jgi:hypothetical protein
MFLFSCTLSFFVVEHSALIDDLRYVPAVCCVFYLSHFLKIIVSLPVSSSLAASSSPPSHNFRQTHSLPPSLLRNSSFRPFVLPSHLNCDACKSGEVRCEMCFQHLLSFPSVVGLVADVLAQPASRRCVRPSPSQTHETLVGVFFFVLSFTRAHCLVSQRSVTWLFI